MRVRARPLHPSDLGLILSYKCQSACAHCLYNCGPAWTEWMQPAEVQEALQAMTVWKGGCQVHLTGGEPFLNFPLLLRAAEMARDLDLPAYVETNAGWCVREGLIEERFTALREAGLRAVLISCSPFHAETIPPERTWLAIGKALEVFGPEGVIVYLPGWIEQVRSFGNGQTTSLDRYLEAYGRERAGRLFWRGYGLIPGGRSGYRLGHLAHRQPPEAFSGENCRQEILFAHHSHFDLYGNFISGFCGGLTVGSWRNLPEVLELFDAHRYPPLIAVLLDSGPFGMYEMASREHDYQPSAEGYAGKCHLCVDVRRHLVVRGVFRAELRPRQFYEMF